MTGRGEASETYVEEAGICDWCGGFGYDDDRVDVPCRRCGGGGPGLEIRTTAPTAYSVPTREYRTTLNGDTPCQDCGTDENPVWFTDSVFWNNVCIDDNPILCLRCFILRAEAKGFRPTGWHVTPSWPWRLAEPEEGNR